ncbi:MAG: XdhC family protein [Opitutaceae bacterium]|jgi:xanthine/CO dehydrogenase XdhC/CoxF family maturation factor|nr:XdhC family protein [Opitutaceae bacterium]
MSDWPRLLPFASARGGEALALATLVARSGSSYRPAGARLLVGADGAFSGSLSGGCLEDEVAAAATRVLGTGAPSIHEVDTRPHFGCPGRLTIFIERLPDGWPAELAGRLARREVFYVRTDYRAAGGLGGSRLLDETPAEETGVLVERVGPAPRVVVVSGTSDADHVVGLGRLLGWEMRRILPAGEPSKGEDDARGEVCRPDDIVRRFPPDAGTAVVVMTHHLARDLAFLREVLPVPYAYVGLLGSSRRRELLLAELGEAGVLADDAALERLHAPVGLDLGAVDPASVALAVVAEIQCAWSGRQGGRLRDLRK